MKAKKNIVASKMVKMLDAYLRLDANSATSAIMYQEKAPEGLKKYKKEK